MKLLSKDQLRQEDAGLVWDMRNTLHSLVALTLKSDDQSKRAMVLSMLKAMSGQVKLLHDQAAQQPPRQHYAADQRPKYNPSTNAAANNFSESGRPFFMYPEFTRDTDSKRSCRKMGAYDRTGRHGATASCGVYTVTCMKSYMALSFHMLTEPEGRRDMACIYCCAALPPGWLTMDNACGCAEYSNNRYKGLVKDTVYNNDILHHKGGGGTRGGPHKCGKPYDMKDTPAVRDQVCNSSISEQVHSRTTMFKTVAKFQTVNHSMTCLQKFYKHQYNQRADKSNIPPEYRSWKTRPMPPHPQQNS